jgi:hypothetical protein
MPSYLCKITVSKIVEVYIDASDEDYLDDEVADYVRQHHPDTWYFEHDVIHHIDRHEEHEL